jgi:hypothetical protein
LSSVIPHFAQLVIEQFTCVHELVIYPNGTFIPARGYGSIPPFTPAPTKRGQVYFPANSLRPFPASPLKFPLLTTGLPDRSFNCPNFSDTLAFPSATSRGAIPGKISISG